MVSQQATGHCKLIDFGLSVVLDPIREAGTRGGPKPREYFGVSAQALTAGHSQGEPARGSNRGGDGRGHSGGAAARSLTRTDRDAVEATRIRLRNSRRPLADSHRLDRMVHPMLRHMRVVSPCLSHS